MPRRKWHLTHLAHPYPTDAIGLASDYAGMRGCYAADYVDHTRPEPEESDPDRDGDAEREEPDW